MEDNGFRKALTTFQRWESEVCEAHIQWIMSDDSIDNQEVRKTFDEEKRQNADLWNTYHQEYGAWRRAFDVRVAHLEEQGSQGDGSSLNEILHKKPRAPVLFDEKGVFERITESSRKRKRIENVQKVARTRQRMVDDPDYRSRMMLDAMEKFQKLDPRKIVRDANN